MGKLNLDFYRPKDDTLYSDGSIEKELLGRLQAGERIDWYADKRWAVVYHFSELRQNILNWYPFRKNAKVLEIGAGCGALTGLLCRKCASVVAIELTLTRAEINLLRHGEYENLQIVVGDFNRVVLEEKFDYVIVNGVLEYAAYMLQSFNPPKDFLEKAASFLRPDGRMLVAIENRLGFKYLSGAREDHTGKFFSGINDYPGERVHTFSREELQHIIRQAHLNAIRFFYPYPDYKFPTEIFTDRTVNDMAPSVADYRMDAGRIDLFQTEKFYQSLMMEKCAGIFANSFLVEISSDTMAVPTPYAYVKISNNRHKQLSLCTIIDDHNQVRKKALFPQGEAHIAKMRRNAGREIVPGMRNGSCQEDDGDGIVFPFIQGQTVKTAILQAYAAGQYNAVDQQVAFVRDKIFSAGKVSIQQENEQFTQVFGTERCAAALHWMPCGNIDIVPDNLFLVDGLTVIDYEWQMDFPVPAEFAMWRFLVNLRDDGGMKDYLTPEKLSLLLCCDQEAMECFERWNRHFSEIYVGSKGMWALSQPVVPLDLDQGVLALRTCKELHDELVQVYSDKGTLKLENQQMYNELVQVYSTKGILAMENKQMHEELLQVYSDKGILTLENQRLSDELVLMRNSRGWKLLERLRHVLRR